MTYIAIYNKEIVLKLDKSFLRKEDVEKLQNFDHSAEYFEEAQNDLGVLNLSTIENLPEQFFTMTLREYNIDHSIEERFFAYRAQALINWRKATKFCCTCGTKLVEHKTLTAFECPECKAIHFPRIEPCIIVLINKGDKILLARHANRNQDMYACIAGFMEAGESAEEAVKREVMEEVGLKIKNIKYRGSQSWPFPSQLMLGFTAEYESGEIRLQEEELSDAQWFDRDNCPPSPKPGSIAYRLINGEY